MKEVCVKTMKLSTSIFVESSAKKNYPGFRVATEKASIETQKIKLKYPKIFSSTL